MVQARFDVEALRREAEAASAHGPGSPHTRIEALAYAIGQKAPAVLAEASEILGLIALARASGPSRDDIMEVIEEVGGDEISGSTASRIAEAILRLCRVR